MLSRLPTPLAEIKAGNNSEKLKNEKKTQILCSLHCSSKSTKIMYKHLYNTIYNTL